jgi:hypothetical protein
MVTGPTVAESEVSATAVPVNARQQPNVATVTAIDRAILMRISHSSRGSSTCEDNVNDHFVAQKWIAHYSHSKVFYGNRKQAISTTHSPS